MTNFGPAICLAPTNKVRTQDRETSLSSIRLLVSLGGLEFIISANFFSF